MKPNETKKPLDYETKMVVQQLNYLGVMDTIRIRKEGFPVRQ